MNKTTAQQPTLARGDNIPLEVRSLCERIDRVADGLPVLLFIPNANHSRLIPLVLVQDDAGDHARLVASYLHGERMDPPSEAMQRQQELTLEAIHAAADYLPVIAFLPAGKGLHPINLVPETVPKALKPCYLAVQQAQKTAIGDGPIDVSNHTALVE